MSSVSLVIFVAFLVAGSSVICCLAKEENTTLHCFPDERKTLLKFKTSFSDPSRRLWSWNNTNIDCCKWKGVQCDNITRHVIGVDLRNENFNGDDVYSSADMLFSGKLDSSIGEIKHLSFLDVSGNNFQLASLPAFIGSMNQLQYLNLSFANFTGIIPHQLGNLSRLSVLDLSHNGYHSLSVDDFTWVSRLSSLRYLDMSSVNFTQTKDLLKVLNMLPSIVTLRLSNCGLENRKLQHACVINSTTLFPNIRYLDLSRNFFTGELPCFLENMTSLQDLHLSDNSYNSCNQFIHMFRLTNLVNLDLSDNSFQCTADGTFEFIPNNCNLESLDLEWNSFSGDVSNFFRVNSSKCLDRKLAKLDLGENQFYGQLPEEVGGFKKLEYLDLWQNLISGPIPRSISNLSALTTLYLAENEFNGSIPSSFKNLTSLTELRLNDNQLSGEIPPSLGQLQNLESLFIENNYFHGIVSESHFAMLSKLQYLYIGKDLTKLRVGSDWTPPFQLRVGSDWTPPFQLEIFSIESCEIEGGQFPKWLQTQKELQSLHMSNCSISGLIPDWLGHLNLTELNLPNNRIVGSLPDSLCEMNYLGWLDLSRNRLSGNLKECFANLTSLGFLDLSSNRFSGVIPNSIGGAYSLELLQLSDNSFTGELPSSLRNCTDLSILDIGQNKLSGRVPKWIGKYLLSLEALRLRDNDLYGTIPFELCQLSKLKIMDLANNKLTGNIPRCFGNFSDMVDMVSDPYPTHFEDTSMQEVMKGADMEYFLTQTNLVNIDLSNNDLVGEIPLELTRLAALNGLNLSHNHLQGMIPGGIGEMKSLESLDLSNNNLFGNIPASLSDLDSLGFLNLSHNNLSGEIPTGRHLQTLDDPRNYEGNPGLCGAPLLKKCNGDKTEGTPSAVFSQTDEEETKADRIWFYGVVISGFATGFWGAIGVLMFKRGWRFAYFKFADDIIGRVFGR